MGISKIFSFFNSYTEFITYKKYESKPQMTEESIVLIGRHLEKIKGEKIDLRRNFKAYTSEFYMDDPEDLYCSMPELDTEFMDEGSDQLRDTEWISMFDVLPIFGLSSEIDIPLEKISIKQTTMGFDVVQEPKRECVYKNGIINVRV